MKILNKFFGKDEAQGGRANSASALNSVSAVNSAQEGKAPKERKARKMNANLNITTPCQSELEKWLKEWDKLENYRNQESALNKLFHDTYPRNVDLDDVLVKVATLNDFYSTNIYNIFAVAKHIYGLSRVDERLKSGDESLVNEIANVIVNGKARNFYSFATKFCSHHNDKDYAIFDSYVEQMLWHFQKRDKFGDFAREDLRDYAKFKKALNDLKAFYGLQCDLKQLDMYLWQAGKMHFARF